MKDPKPNRLVAMLLYNGSTDERNQRLYDRAGYYSFLFLFTALLGEVLFKLFALRQAPDQILAELVLLVLSALILTALCVGFGVSLFENPKQKDRFRRFFWIFGVVLLSVAGYLPLLLKLPMASRILELGPLGWVVPPAFGIVAVAVIWGLTKLVDLLGKRRTLSKEGQE